MATNVLVPVRSRFGQLTYTTTISALVGGLTPQFVLPSGVNTWSIGYVLAGAGSLQMQQSSNDPLEIVDQRSASGIPQVWGNCGSASTGGTQTVFNGAGAPTMLRGSVTGGAGGDILTITISAAYINA